MEHLPTTRRSFVQLITAASLPFGWSGAHALCAAPPEMGRWRNLAAKGDPAVLDLRMTDCGDQSLNGEQTQTRFAMRVWVLQSSGNYYGRPSVRAGVQSWKGSKWFVGRVPTGGYVDHIWARVEQRDGQRQLHVLIKHESLDSKPSASSEHWFRFEKRI